MQEFFNYFSNDREFFGKIANTNQDFGYVVEMFATLKYEYYNN